MIRVGITGGIGSGKSTVCRIFSVLGVPIYKADIEARKLQDSDPDIKSGLTSIFGDSIYFRSGCLDRKKLAGIVFEDRDLLKAVNSLVHPKVQAHFGEWEKVYSFHSYIVYEAAILFESGIYKEMDKVLLVCAPEHLRVERVVMRDRMPAWQVVNRMRNQMTDEEKRELADIVVENDNKRLIVPRVVDLDKRLKAGELL